MVCIHKSFLFRTIGWQYHVIRWWKCFKRLAKVCGIEHFQIIECQVTNKYLRPKIRRRRVLDRIEFGARIQIMERRLNPLHTMGISMRGDLLMTMMIQHIHFLHCIANSLLILSTRHEGYHHWHVMIPRLYMIIDEDVDKVVSNTPNMMLCSRCFSV